MSCTVSLVEEAEEQVQHLSAWWRANRPLAPGLFLEELAGAIDLLASAPDIGQRFHRSPVAGTRRLPLLRSKQFVYYVHDRAREVVYVIAVWGMARGAGPPLRSSLQHLPA